MKGAPGRRRSGGVLLAGKWVKLILEINDFKFWQTPETLGWRKVYVIDGDLG